LTGGWPCCGLALAQLALARERQAADAAQAAAAEHDAALGAR